MSVKSRKKRDGDTKTVGATGQSVPSKKKKRMVAIGGSKGKAK